MSQDQAKKSSRTRCGCFGCLGIFIILAVPIWYFCLHTAPLKISKETTYVLGPKTADGKRIDYFLAMEERYYPPEMKTDNNGYRLLVRACGVKTEKPDPEHYRQQVYEKLGLDPNIKPTLKLESTWKTLDQYEKEHPAPEGEERVNRRFNSARMWTLDDYPMLKDWLEENNASLDLLGEAVRKPVFRIPYYRANENTPDWESLFFSQDILIPRWNEAAAARAKYRLGIGNIDGAIDDILTIYHLARHVEKMGTFHAKAFGSTIEDAARSIGIACNPDFPPTKAQIERFLTEIDALPPRWTFDELIESERLSELATIQDMLVRKAPPELLRYVYTKVWYLPLDINIAMKRLNEKYDAIHPFSETLLDRYSVEGGIWIHGPPIITNLSELWRLLFTRNRTIQFMDTQFSLNELEHLSFNPQFRCAENVQHLTLALLLYEKEHGKLPEEDWREAVKPYLGKNPEQYFRCPARKLAEDETAYAMIEGVSSLSPSPEQILIVEVLQPQKLGEGNGRIPLEQAGFVERDEQSALGLGSHPGFIFVGQRSGAVDTLSESVAPEALRKMLE